MEIIGVLSGLIFLPLGSFLVRLTGITPWVFAWSFPSPRWAVSHAYRAPSALPYPSQSFEVRWLPWPKRNGSAPWNTWICFSGNFLLTGKHTFIGRAPILIAESLEQATAGEKRTGVNLPVKLTLSFLWMLSNCLVVCSYYRFSSASMKTKLHSCEFRMKIGIFCTLIRYGPQRVVIVIFPFPFSFSIAIDSACRH